MDPRTIETRVDELRAAHPDRHDFIRAVQEFSRTLDAEGRDALGKVLLSREPSTGGFEVLDHQRRQWGWIRRTMRKLDTREEPPRG